MTVLILFYAMMLSVAKITCHQ